MAEKTLTARFKQKVDTSTNWAANNPVLLVGEIGCESDTFKIKVGDGTTAWNSLSYVIADVDLTEIENEISEVKSDVATNTSNISTNTSNISSLQSAVNTNTKNISTNTSNISTNTSDISTLKSSVSSNTSNISTNASDISTLTTTVSSKADDSGVVHITGAETITGTKTFSNSITGKISQKVSDGNYVDMVQALDSTTNNKVGTIRIENYDGYNQMVLGVHNESNGAPGGLIIKSVDGTTTFNLNGTTYPRTSESFDLGSSTLQWRNLFLSGDANVGGTVTATTFSGNLTDGTNTITATDVTNKPGLIVTDTDTGYVGEIFNDYENNVASGYFSHAEGYHTTASGESSHAEGVNAIASGERSHAGGSGTRADQSYQTAIGKYNLEDQSGSLLAVGNGTSSSARSNAFEVFQDGHVEISSGTITYDASTDTFTI